MNRRKAIGSMTAVAAAAPLALGADDGISLDPYRERPARAEPGWRAARDSLLRLRGGGIPTVKVAEIFPYLAASDNRMTT
jgi:hypothetical protein